MKFEWDEDKRLANASKHGIDFRDAARIFEGETLTMIDDRYDYDEERFVSIGLIQGRILPSPNWGGWGGVLDRAHGRQPGDTNYFSPKGD